jgi:hypothetical protein
MMGKQTFKDKVVARVHDILVTHQPSSIKPETDEVIQEVLEQAEDRVESDEWTSRTQDD